MSKRDIELELRASKDFDTPQDRHDPRTPERRAEARRAEMAAEAWSRLPWVTAINLALMGLISALAAPLTGLSLISIGLLAAGALLALLARWAGGLAPARRRWVMGLEALCSGLGAAALAFHAQGAALALPGLALCASPMARRGAAAWIHLGLAAAPAALAAASLGRGPAAAVLLLAITCAVQTRYQSRQIERISRLGMENREMEALCRQLAAGAEGDGA